MWLFGQTPTAASPTAYAPDVPDEDQIEAVLASVHGLSADSTGLNGMPVIKKQGR